MAASKKKKKSDEDEGGLSKEEFGEAFAGIVEAGFLMAAADGEFDESEIATIAATISGLIEGVTDDEIVEVLDASLEALEADGWEARIAAVGENLRGSNKDGAAHYAMMLASLVYMADGEGEDEEGTAFYQLAEALGYDESAADTIYDEVAEDVDDE